MLLKGLKYDSIEDIQKAVTDLLKTIPKELCGYGKTKNSY